MSEIVNNTFWAVFYGSTLGTLTVYLITSLLDEYRSNKHRKEIELLMEEWEDLEDQQNARINDKRPPFLVSLLGRGVFVSKNGL